MYGYLFGVVCTHSHVVRTSGNEKCSIFYLLCHIYYHNIIEWQRYIDIALTQSKMVDEFR